MYTIGYVAKRFSISRSTLLYYDKFGLLKPSERSEAKYRLYSQSYISKLERILQFRRAGLSLIDIRKIIDKSTDELEKKLESRLFSINKEIQSLREQQQVIINMIKGQGCVHKTRIVTVDKWSSILRASGLDEKGMWDWHKAFEASSPEAHQDFLESLGIPLNEIADIRNKSK